MIVTTDDGGPLLRHELMAPVTECNSCGACCSPVVSVFAPTDLRRMMPGRLSPTARLDIAHLRDHCTPISRREGLARAPYLSDGVTVMGVPGSPESTMISFSFFYECEYFDSDTRRCTNYDNRPPMCADYPWYGQDPLATETERSKALPRMCSFRADIGKPVEAIPVEWLPTRKEASS